METYRRHVVYRRTPGDEFRPHVSFDYLREAVEFIEEMPSTVAAAPFEWKVIDLEHLHLGDMLKARECAVLVTRIRLEIARRVDASVTE